MKLFNKTQTGRSIVEILGVLAIIGVLSVGSIAGYSKAMYKHNLNKSLDIFSSVITKLIELDGKSGIEISNQNDILNYDILTDCNTTKISENKNFLARALNVNCRHLTFIYLCHQMKIIL